jgi:hypothetical protein
MNNAECESIFNIKSAEYIIKAGKMKAQRANSRGKLSECQEGPLGLSQLTVAEKNMIGLRRKHF